MSYDLFFTEPKITLKQFLDYFSDRNHYRVENSQACYENEDTGVYFSFEYSDEQEGDPEAPNGNVSFNLNFFRPHYFALEAEPEVQSVVNHFGFKIFDPQFNGMDEGPYSRDGFLTGWNHGNEFGYSAMLNSEKPLEIIHSRSGDELESIWKWNYAREKNQNTFGESVFVPKIMFLQIDGNIMSVAVWPDAIPALIPKVDALLIPRQELAPRSLFKKRDDICVAPFERALPLLEPFRANGYSLPVFAFSYTTIPANVTSFVKGLKPHTGDIKGVAMDQVLNQELIEKAREKL